MDNDIESINAQMDNIVTIITPLQSQSEIQNILNNKKNNVHIEWLTTKKATWRFMTASFKKRNFFENLYYYDTKY